MLLPEGEGMKIKWGVTGIDKLHRDLKKLGKVPQKHVTASARKGMNVVLKGAKSNAPVDTGDLKRGMKLSGEKSRYKGKKVYRINFNPSMNDVFQKPIKNPGSRGGSGKDTAYYPISQEYGYFAGDGNYIPGYRFIHDSLTSNSRQMVRVVVEEMEKKIDQEIRKAGLR